MIGILGQHFEAHAVLGLLEVSEALRLSVSTVVSLKADRLAPGLDPGVDQIGTLTLPVLPSLTPMDWLGFM